MSLHSLTLLALNVSLISVAIHKVTSGRPSRSRPTRRAAHRAAWSVSSLGPRRGIDVAYLGTEDAFDVELVLVQRPGEFGDPVVLLSRSASRVTPGATLNVPERAAPIFDLPGVRLEMSWSSLAGSFHLEVMELAPLRVPLLQDETPSVAVGRGRHSPARGLIAAAHTFK